MRYTLSMAFSVTYTDPAQLSDRQLLLLILERLTTMSTVADNTAAAVAALDAKVDTLIAVVTPALDTLRASLAAALAQIADLQAGDAADAATLSATISAADAEAVKVQAAIDALTPPAPTP